MALVDSFVCHSALAMVSAVILHFVLVHLARWTVGVLILQVVMRRVLESVDRCTFPVGVLLLAWAALFLWLVAQVFPVARVRFVSTRLREAQLVKVEALTCLLVFRRLVRLAC